MVRTRAFQACNPGPIPGGVTILRSWRASDGAAIFCKTVAEDALRPCPPTVSAIALATAEAQRRWKLCHRAWEGVQHPYPIQPTNNQQKNNQPKNNQPKNKIMNQSCFFVLKKEKNRYNYHTMKEVLLYFILYSFIGWIIDTGFRSFKEGKFSQGSFLKLPFCSTYGFGALLLLTIRPIIIEQNTLNQFLLLAIILSTVEFILGFISFHVWKKHYWNYSKKPFNLFGYTDIEHAIYWGGLGVIFINFIHPIITKLISF